MPTFEYLTFMCEQSALQSRLSDAGVHGWRLHTCEPVATVGQFGSGLLNVFVVLDRAIYPDAPEEVEPEPASEGIAMKG